MPDFDVAIIGGGAVGLAVLHRASARGLEAVLLERHPACGRETSSRNSEVIHGGMYYRPGSLKAKLCVDGRRRLYDFAEKHGVLHKRSGKFIVAVDEVEIPGLEKIYETGRANGIDDLRLLSREELAAMAPEVTAVRAIHSPSTGAVNAHSLMEALEKQAEADGGTVVCGAAVNGLKRGGDGWEVAFTDADGPSSLGAKTVVNTAGLGSQAVMRMAGLVPEAIDLKLYPCKGNYFAVHGESRKRIQHLVYPAPEANLAGLGIHTVIDFSGGVKLGPNTQYLEEADEYDYAVDESLRDKFHESVIRYLPFLDKNDITPDMSGVRSKIYGPGMPARDFYIAHEAERGLPGFINTAGLEAPALTACLAIADMAVGLAEEAMKG